MPFEGGPVVVGSVWVTPVPEPSTVALLGVIMVIFALRQAGSRRERSSARSAWRMCRKSKRNTLRCRRQPANEIPTPSGGYQTVGGDPSMKRGIGLVRCTINNTNRLLWRIAARFRQSRSTTRGAKAWGKVCP